MVNSILTPVTLWKDFDVSLPLNEEILSEREEDGAVIREVYFEGRQTQTARVKIYAQYVKPLGATQFPVIMILFEAGFSPDWDFVARFVKQGYGVFCVDYCGENEKGRYTVYPKDIDYANYVRADRAMKYAEPTARETSWYEWAGVARYAARYLAEKSEVTRFGAIGLRTGGEVLYKVAPFAPFSCFISVCAAGWLAYSGIDKFADGKQRVFDEERHRFIAGVDSQSYAPYAKCPVLLISAINDKKYNYDRVYDTFNQINPQVEKAILFSAHGSGLIGEHSLQDIHLFLDKYLKKHSVYLSSPISFRVEKDEKGDLVVNAKFDPEGEIVDCGYFFTEKINAFKARDWTRVICPAEKLKENTAKMRLRIFEGCDKILLYTFVRYSNGFSVTSKIQEVTVEKDFQNFVPKSRVIYTGKSGLNGFTALRRRLKTVADCFSFGAEDVYLMPGYGGIQGITSRFGLVSYRVSEPRYEAPIGASLAFDTYCKENSSIQITFYLDEEEETGYSATVKIEGGGKWKHFVLEPDDFKSDTGAPLTAFKGAVSIVFVVEKEALINNVIWL